MLCAVVINSTFVRFVETNCKFLITFVYISAAKCGFPLPKAKKSAIMRKAQGEENPVPK